MSAVLSVCMSFDLFFKESRQQSEERKCTSSCCGCARRAGKCWLPLGDGSSNAARRGGLSDELCSDRGVLARWRGQPAPGRKAGGDPTRSESLLKLPCALDDCPWSRRVPRRPLESKESALHEWWE
uniref:Uncharacterized protein n=1 Tax=Alexandrium catenella TaxID=2925 RepID=A0A7S1M871_ALECA